jgi:antitoxin ParD1/3/4
MNVSLTPELESFVQSQVESGMYFSQSEVVREGLRLLKEQNTDRKLRQRQLQQEVEKGFNAIDRGDYTAYSSASEAATDLKAKARQRAATKQAGS